METEFKNRFLFYISKVQFIVLLISIIFFFAWADFIAKSQHPITDWINLPFWLIVIGGIGIPIILLIRAIQFKSLIAFGATMTIFVLTILKNLASLPYYIREYQYEVPFCSCCPICEIKAIVKIVLACCFAIYLMNRKSLRNLFNWEIHQSLKIISAGTILYFIDKIIF